MNHSQSRKRTIILLTIIAVTILILLAVFIFKYIGFPFIRHKQPFKPGEYYVEVNGARIHTVIKGTGDQTIVLLSGYANRDPITDFDDLAEELCDSFRVVIVEYPGYGLSKDTDKPRTNKNIINEVRKTLDGLNLTPPYILMPHSLSGIYSLYYAVTYPKEVKAIMGIDMAVPNQEKKEETKIAFRNDTKQETTKAKFVSTYSVKKMNFADEKDRVYENAKELFDTPFPKQLPVCMFLASISVEETEPWKGLHEEMISNPDIQKINILDGNHMLYWTQYKKIAELTKQFIKEKCS